jgi:hypothetical protein
MANISSSTSQRRRIRPVDVFVAGIIAAIVGAITILGVIYLPILPELASVLQLAGFLLLAIGTTAAALAILREEGAAEEY